MLKSLRDGFRAVGLNWGLVVLVLLTNLGLALVLAAPLARELDRELAHEGASSAMMYGFVVMLSSLVAVTTPSGSSLSGWGDCGRGRAGHNLRLRLAQVTAQDRPPAAGAPPHGRPSG